MAFLAGNSASSSCNRATISLSTLGLLDGILCSFPFLVVRVELSPVGIDGIIMVGMLEMGVQAGGLVLRYLQRGLELLHHPTRHLYMSFAQQKNCNLGIIIFLPEDNLSLSFIKFTHTYLKILYPRQIDSRFNRTAHIQNMILKNMFVSLETRTTKKEDIY